MTEITLAYKVVNSEYKSLHVNGRYELEYGVNETVKSAPFTLGIMAFQTLQQLLTFCPVDSIIAHDRHVLKVLWTGSIQLKDPLISSVTTEQSLNAFYDGQNHAFTMIAPSGTICFDEVRVLEEVPIQEVVANA